MRLTSALVLASLIVTGSETVCSAQSRVAMSCNPEVRATEPERKYLPCTEKNLSDAMIDECVGPFLSAVDILAGLVQDFGAFQTSQLTPGSVAPGIRALETGQKLKKNIEAFATRTSGYLLNCAGMSVIKSTPVISDAWKLFKDAGSAAESLRKAMPGVEQKPGGEFSVSADAAISMGNVKKVRQALGDLESLTASLERAFAALEGLLLAPAERLSGAPLRGLEHLNAAISDIGQCRAHDADREINLASQIAIRTLEPALLRKAQTAKTRDCAAEKATDFFERAGYSRYNNEINGIPRWQTLDAGTSPSPGAPGRVSADPVMARCDACRDWQDARRAAARAEADASRLQPFLDRVNSACADLKRVQSERGAWEADHASLVDDMERALAEGRCDLSRARSTLERLRQMEADRDRRPDGACLAGSDASAAALQLAARSRDRDCQPGLPAQTVPSPPASGRLTWWGTCDWTWRPWTRPNGTHVAAAKPQKWGPMTISATLNPRTQLWTVRAHDLDIVGSGQSFPLTAANVSGWGGQWTGSVTFTPESITITGESDNPRLSYQRYTTLKCSGTARR